MSLDYETRFHPVVIREISGERSKLTAVSLQVYWNALQGNKDGIIQIIATNDTKSESIGKQIKTLATSNALDAEIMLLQPAFRYIKAKYYANGNSAGQLSILLNYE